MNRSLSNFLSTTLLFCVGLLLTNAASGGLTLWLDAADPNTILDGSGNAVNAGGFNPNDIATWNDKSGHGNHATQGDPGVRPILDSGGWTPNGNDMLRFTEAQFLDGFSVTSSLAAANPTNPGFTAFIVVKSTGEVFAPDGDKGDWDVWLADSNDNAHYINDKNYGPGQFGSSFGGFDGVEGRADGPTRDHHIIMAKYNANTGQMRMHINGAGERAGFRHPDPGEFGPPTIAPPGLTNTYNQIARYAGGGIIGLDGQGDLAEIRFYDEHLSSSIEGIVGAELEQKWGIQISPFIPPTVHNWSVDGSGDWNVSENWDTGFVPDGNDQTAIFGAGITASGQTVFTNQAVTVNQVRFDNTLSYAIGGLGSVNMAATTATIPEPPAIDVLSGNHQFQAIVNLLDSTTADIASGSSLAFNNWLSLNGQTLTKTGGGTLAISNDVVLAGGAIDIQEGTIVGNGTVGGEVVNNGGTISPGHQNAQANSLVPEPTTWLLLGVGLLMTPICGTRKNRSSIGEA